MAGDVDAADEPELADRLVGVDVVAVGLDVAAVVAVLALHWHQFQQLVGNDGPDLAIERPSASGTGVFTSLVTILAQEVA